MTELQNTVSAQQLQGYVERIERILEGKKDLSDDEKVIYAEAQAAGFVPKIVKHVVKVRATKPADYQEDCALADMYLSALGLAPEPPLFRAVGLMGVDVAAKDMVIEALKKLVPADGSITVEAGGKPVKLTRQKDGTVTAVDVEPPRPVVSPASSPPPAKANKPPVPDASPEEAEALGREAARGNTAIIANPFPFGDPRRARWDLGWRKEAGGDGMGD